MVNLDGTRLTFLWDNVFGIIIIYSYLSSFVFPPEFFVPVFWLICDWGIGQAVDKNPVILPEVQQVQAGQLSRVIKIFLEKVLVNCPSLCCDVVMKDSDDEQRYTIEMTANFL